jgi:hypothetical protein
LPTKYTGPENPSHFNPFRKLCEIASGRLDAPMMATERGLSIRATAFAPSG